MRVLLAALNAKYSHTSLSVRSLWGYAAPRCSSSLQWVEYTINHRAEQILEELYRLRPDLLCLSCYLWNIDLALTVAEQYKLVCPTASILLGGPEVSYDSREQLERHPFVDFVLCGEGEGPLVALLQTLEQDGGLDSVPGLTWRSEGGIRQNEAGPLLDLDLLAFPYPSLDGLEQRILYYEASRGCPFQCQYCLSSLDKPVRLRSLSLVLEDLDRFLAAGVRQVKFVDRTFNAVPSFAKAIWRRLIQEDNGVTNFHFEIEAGLLDEEALSLLAAARPGLFQLEIGVQSTNEDTLAAIRRSAKTPELFDRVRRLKALGNIHLHLDLIAGLPYEGLASFQRSFDMVYALRPSQLQLGFLKLLKGTGLHRDAGRYGIVCRPQAPYEVLYTRWLPFADALRLKAVEEVVELYLNSGRFDHLLGWMLAKFPSPFQFFLQLGAFYRAGGFHLVSSTKERQFTILRDFWLTGHPDDPLLPLLCRYDIQLHERPRKWPDWAQPEPDPALRDQLLALLTPDFLAGWLPTYGPIPPKQVLRLISAERFPLDPETLEPAPTLCLFDYSRRDVNGHATVLKFHWSGRALWQLDNGMETRTI